MTAMPLHRTMIMYVLLYSGGYDVELEYECMTRHGKWETDQWWMASRWKLVKAINKWSAGFSDHRSIKSKLIWHWYIGNTEMMAACEWKKILGDYCELQWESPVLQVENEIQ